MIVKLIKHNHTREVKYSLNGVRNRFIMNCNAVGLINLAKAFLRAP